MQSRRILGSISAVAITVGLISPVHASAMKADDPVTGRWIAALTIPAGDVDFSLELKRAGSLITGAIQNGSERQELSGGSFDGKTLELRLDYYDGRIVARFENENQTRLIGEYVRQTRNGLGKYPFKAKREQSAGRPANTANRSAAAAMAGEWVVTVNKSDGMVEEIDEATFKVGVTDVLGKAPVSGTIIPVSGDYGLLSGSVSAGPSGVLQFSLSRFDGIHVTLVKGECRTDGTLAGEIASGLTYRAKFTAVRRYGATTPHAKPNDPFGMTTVKEPDVPFAFSFPDTEGKTVSLADPRFKNKVLLIDLMGTWCPNCHDETPLLVELYRQYHDKGLEVVSFAYEYTPDVERSRKQIDIFRKKYGVEFPILLPGTTAEGEMARTMPRLVNFGAYPTTLFIGRDGRVRKIHAGFSGPATGPRHDEVKKRFRDLVEGLLVEK